MCDAIDYIKDDYTVTVYFDSPTPQLPIRLRSGLVTFETWGVPTGEDQYDGNTPGFLQKLPIGSCATLASIKANEWLKYEPQPVKIVCSRFLKLHPMLGPCYFELKPKQFPQGLLATVMRFQRVYVVTIPPPAQPRRRLGIVAQGHNGSPKNNRGIAFAIIRAYESSFHVCWRNKQG